MQPPAKRSFLPVASTHTTAEHYGQKFGIPDDVQAALQSVGRMGRMSELARHASFTCPSLMPVVQMSVRAGHLNGHRPCQISHPPLPRHPHLLFPHTRPQPNGKAMTDFITDSQAIANAHEAIYQEDLKRRELQPYSLMEERAAIRVRGSSPAPFDSDIDFRSDGIDADGMNGRTRIQRTKGWASVKGKGEGRERGASKSRLRTREKATEVEDDQDDFDFNGTSQSHDSVGLGKDRCPWRACRYWTISQRCSLLPRFPNRSSSRAHLKVHTRALLKKQALHNGMVGGW